MGTRQERLGVSKYLPSLPEIIVKHDSWPRNLNVQSLLVFDGVVCDMSLRHEVFDVDDTESVLMVRLGGRRWASANEVSRKVKRGVEAGGGKSGHQFGNCGSGSDANG